MEYKFLSAAFLKALLLPGPAMGDADSLQRLPHGFAEPLETPQLLMAPTGWDHAYSCWGTRGPAWHAGLRRSWAPSLCPVVLGPICSTPALVCLHEAAASWHEGQDLGTLPKLLPIFTPVFPFPQP